MAYNQYFPQYNPYYAAQYQAQPQQAITAPSLQPQQNQNGGIIISISGEAEARSYPVGLGNSITFKDENAPYIYTKTMGFSQLDRPVFEKYRLVKEDTPVEEPQANNLSYDDIRDQIEMIKSDIEDIKKKMAPKTVKKIMKEIEVEDDDT